MILELVHEAVKNGARLRKAADIIDLSVRTLIRWKKTNGDGDRRRGPADPPANKLSPLERQRVIETANSPDFRDLSPKQIVPLLSDQGVYIASDSTFYRILRQEGMMRHRESSKPAQGKRPEGYTATGPCQVWSWDITYLNTCIRGKFFYLYMIVDIWSRKIIAARVHETESMDLSAALIRQSCMLHNTGPENMVLHSDNGGPMKGATMLATMRQLGITPSFSRPSVSNDNPYSESLFRTMKYRPSYPGMPFDSLQQAQTWVDDFVIWYNTEHLHSGIRYLTPDDRHYGRQENILAKRHEVYQNARKQNPQRWASHTRNWNPVREVKLNPLKEKQDLNEAAIKNAA